MDLSSLLYETFPIVTNFDAFSSACPFSEELYMVKTVTNAMLCPEPNPSEEVEKWVLLRALVPA